MTWDDREEQTENHRPEKFLLAIIKSTSHLQMRDSLMDNPTPLTVTALFVMMWCPPTGHLGGTRCCTCSDPHRY